jgi:TolB-like protein
MGEVYEAEDLELRERVALKTIRPEVAREEQALERFKREIHLARKVTHPGVCRVFDVFRDRTSEGETIVLSMELLAGETLAERLRRSGRMSTVDVLPLVSQMAAALEAAHEAGIVHRDFKTGNVMLVPNVAPTFRSAPEGLKPGVGTEGPGSRGQQADAAAGEIPTRQLRAVVTDFGLARSAVGAEDAATTLVATPGMAGTPAYMAPEQVEGGKVTAAADLYALGVVMYEMVTGRQPFVGDTPLSTAVKRLKEPPPSPRKLAPDLDPQWERVILRCLERNPAHRFASAADVAQALAGERRTFPERRGRRQLAAVVATILVLGVLAGGYWLYLQRAAPRRAVTANMPAGTVKARRSVAVLGFKNLSPAGPSAAWLSTAFSEMFASELAAGSQLRLVSGETVARMKKELSLSEAGTYANDTLGAIRKDCGADLVVLGSYVALGPQSGEQVRLDLRVQDTATGDTVATASEAGAEREIFDLVKKSGDELRKELGVAAVSVADATRVRASLPPNPEAARLYSEGLAKLRVFDALGARDLLEKAVVADPSSALAHSALARAWAGLGYEAKARNEAKEAMDLSPRLSREDRLEIEGSYYTMAHQYGRAAAVYRALWTFYPDNLDYGLRLAGA